MILDEIYDDNKFKQMLKIAAQDVITARGYGDIESYLKELSERGFDEFQDVLVQEDMPAIAVAAILQKAFDKAGKMCNWDHEDPTIWPKLYDKIFSEDVSRKVWKMFPGFDYYDPDASYYEDVHAFVSNFVDFAKEIAEIEDKTGQKVLAYDPKTCSGVLGCATQIDNGIYQDE